MTVSDDDINTMLNEELLARRTKVMFLRNAGATWATVAAETGVSESTCRKDYAVVCRDINAEQPSNVIARHRAVIFDIQRANYPRMMQGDKDAAATILRALDREAKLLGLDAPTKIMAAVSSEEFANEAARLIARINQLDPTTMKELERVNQREADYIDADPIDPIDTAVGAGDGGQTGQPASGVEGDGDGAPAARVAAAHEGGGGEGPDGAGDAGVVQGPVGPPDLDSWSNIEDD